jgi:uncharacterized protein YPO0396
MTQPDALFQQPNSDEQQWRLDALLLCNWGGFDGVHEIDMTGLSTLISGVSGAGKSTVLDAWTTLLTPSVALNAASNDAGARTRGDGTRTTLTYVRGQYGLGSEREVPLVLRGANRPGPLDADPHDTWSAIAAVFVSTTGIHYTFVRTFFAPREAVNPSDMKTQYAVFVGRLTARHVRDYLEPAARDNEFGKTALERLPGLSVLISSGYSEELQRRLGIGAHGAGDKALRLLADIQRGKPVPRVSRLFQDLVLDKPITFEKADKVIESFDGLDKMHTQMRDAEDQLAVLDGLDDDHADMTAAMAEIAEIDTLGLTSPDRSRFLYWAHQRKAELYEEEALLLAEQHEQATVALDEREKDVADRWSEFQDANNEYLGAGGGDADAVRRELERFKETHQRVEGNRKRFTDKTDILDIPVPESIEQFTRLQQQARRFLATYPAALNEVKSRNASVQQAKWGLKDKIDQNRAEIDRLARTSGNINGHLVAVRDQFAIAAGIPTTELPFVGELLDAHPEWEHWRKAADSELAGFANSMVLDERIQTRFERAIDGLPDLRRRLNFRGVPINLPTDAPIADRFLAGRLIVRDGPFEGWLRRHVNTTYDLLCVESADDLADDGILRITINGQTKRGKRGAHGSTGRVIGFSNVGRRAELQEEIAQWEEDLVPVEAQLTDLDVAERKLNDERAAHQHVLDTQWADFDLQRSRKDVDRAEAELHRLTHDRNIEALESRRDQAKQRYEQAVGDRSSQVAVVDDIQARTKTLDADASALNALLDTWRDDAAAVPTDEQIEELNTRLGQLADTTWDGSPDGFDNAVKTLQLILKQDLSIAAGKRDAAAAQITARFREYQAHDGWQSDSRGATLADYEDYLAILNDLHDQGLHAQRRKWARAVIEWSGEDLSELIQSYRRAQDDIDERLRPIRQILATVPFGRDGDTLDIEAVHRSPAPVAAYLHELRTLATGTMDPNATDDQVLDKFNTIRAVVARIRNGKDERSALLDIRRHLTVKARAGQLVYDHLGELSGGEGQMITAFIVGAALRYHLGDEKRNRPRFAPVVLDEAFIKADGEYTGSAVEAWKQLGFQLIVGAPEEKVNSLEAALDLSIVVTKNPDHYSYARAIPRKPATG